MRKPGLWRLAVLALLGAVLGMALGGCCVLPFGPGGHGGPGGPRGGGGGGGGGDGPRWEAPRHGH